MTDTKGSDVQHDTIEVAQEAKPTSAKKATSSSSKTTKTSSAAKADEPKKASATKKTTKTSTTKKTTTSKTADTKEGVEKTASKKSATAASAEKKPTATKKAASKKTATATTKSATAAKKTTKASATSVAESKTSPKTASSKASSSLAKGAKEAETTASSGDDKKATGTTKAKAPQKRAASSAKPAASKTTKSAATKTAAKTTKATSAKPAESASSESVDSSAKASQPAVGILEGSKSLPLEGSKAKGLPAGEVHAALASQENKALQEDKKTALAGSSAKSLSGTSKALPAGETDEGEPKPSPAKKTTTTKKAPRKTTAKTATKSTKTNKAKEEASADTKAASSAGSEGSASEEISETQGKAMAPEKGVSEEKSPAERSDLSATQPSGDVLGNVSDDVSGDASGNTSDIAANADSQDAGEGALETPVADEKEAGKRDRRPNKKTSSAKSSPQKSTKSEAEKQDDEAEGDGQAEKRGKASSKTEAKKNQPPSRTQRRKMFVSVMPEEQIEVVITEEGQVQEYYVEMLQQQKTKGNIYKATIHNVDANLQAAFINYGANKNGFLQIDEVHPEYYNVPHDEKSGRRFPPIQKVLKPGQELLVQVVKEPNASKGAFLTTYLSLAGRFLVLTPGREQIGVSRKVDDGGERGRLREMLEDFKPGPGLGVIVRTVSIGMNKATLKKDLQSLKATWKKVRTLGTEEVAPKLIHEEIGLATRSVRDYLTDQIVEVWLDDPDTAKDVDELVSTLFPKKSKLVHVHTDFSISLFERFNLQRQLDQIQSREVPLPSGGRLVIDTTEALTAIDINSGRSGGKSNFEDTAFRTNMEAAKMIPLQLRLRDIGGQVVCDFIEMRDKSHWREVEKTVRGAMKIDRARHDVGRISSFGLLELVRQRLGSSAISVNMEVCPHCKGSGVRRNMEWQSQQALKDIARKMRAAKEQKQASISYGVEVGLAMHLLNSKRQRLNHLEDQLGVSVEITLAEQE